MRPITLILIAFIFFSCQGQENVVTEIFSFEQATGLWVPYEVNYDNGTIRTEELAMFDLFAPYMGSFKLNKDGSYIPFLWVGIRDYQFNQDHAGVCELISGQLFFNSTDPWKIDFQIIKFENNELWLKRLDFLMKFKREM